MNTQAMSSEDSIDPIAMLNAFNESEYKLAAERAYLDIMGIDPEPETKAIETEPATDPIEEPEQVSAPAEPVKRSLMGNVTALLKKLTGSKPPEPVAEADPVSEEQPEEETVLEEPVIELPPLEKIESILFADSRFHMDPSWLTRLSQRRATNVKDYLVTTKGIDASRVFISGEASDADSEKDSTPLSSIKFDLTD